MVFTIFLLTQKIKAESLEESLIILSQALGAEVKTLVGNVELILPDLESHLVDEQNSKPRLNLKKVRALVMLPSVEGSVYKGVIIVADATQEGRFKTILSSTQLNNAALSYQYYLMPIDHENEKSILIAYKWKQRQIFIFLEREYLQSVSQGQNLLFQDVWLINHENIILSHSNKNWFAQKMSDLDKIESGNLRSQASGRWTGRLQENDLTLFYQAVPETNLKLIGVQFTSVPIKSNHILLLVGAVLILAGVGVGISYFKRDSSRGNQKPEPTYLVKSDISFHEFMQLIAEAPININHLQERCSGTKIEKYYSYVKTQFEKGSGTRTVIPWAKVVQDSKKYSVTWMTVADLIDKLSNIPALSIKKIDNLIPLIDGQLKLSYQLIQNLIHAALSFLQEGAAFIEINNLTIEFVDGALIVKLNISVSVESADFEWLNWVLQNVAQGGVLANSVSEHQLLLKFLAETKKFGQNKSAEDALSHKRIQSQVELELDEKLKISPLAKSASPQPEALSEEALNHAMTVLDSAPEKSSIEADVKLTHQFSDIAPEQTSIHYKRPSVLNIATQIRKPRGKSDVT